MQVKMSEYFQGSGVSAEGETGAKVTVLLPDETYTVDAVLGKWLIDNRKAVEIERKAEPKLPVSEIAPTPEQPVDAWYSEMPQAVEVERDNPVMATTSPSPYPPVPPSDESVVVERPRSTSTHKRHGGK